MYYWGPFIISMCKSFLLLTLSSNQVGPLLKQITTVCPVQLFILHEIHSQPLFSMYCFTPTVQHHVSILTCCCGTIQNCVAVLCSITMLCRFSSFYSFYICGENEYDMGHMELSTFGWTRHTNVSFINLNCTLLLNLLSSLSLFTCFTCICRLPQHNGGGGRWGVQRVITESNLQLWNVHCGLQRFKYLIFWVMLTCYKKKLFIYHNIFRLSISWLTKTFV
jgi:hypothetical protein